MGLIANVAKDLGNGVSNATKGATHGAQCPLKMVKKADVMGDLSVNVGGNL